MTKIALLAVVAFIWIVSLLSIFFLSRYISKNKDQDVRVMTNEHTNDSNFNKFGFLLYVLISGVIAWIVLKFFGIAFVSAMIFLHPFVVLFNSRKRTGKILVLIFSIGALFVSSFMTYLIIGIPVTPPTIHLGGREIMLGDTTVSTLHELGFDIYVRKNSSNVDYEQLLTSDTFELYTYDESVMVPSDNQIYYDALENQKYLLVLENTVIGGFIPYGNDASEMALENCSVIYITLNEDSISAMKEMNYDFTVNDVSMMERVDPNDMKDTFGTYFTNEIWGDDEGELDYNYLIHFVPSSGHVFFSAYYINLSYFGDSFHSASITCRNPE